MLGGAAGQSEPPTEGRGDTVGSLSFFFYGYLRLVGIGNGEINTCDDFGASEREYSGFSGSIACFGKRAEKVPVQSATVGWQCHVPHPPALYKRSDREAEPRVITIGHPGPSDYPSLC
jgi:hypothetical protein